jgi:hypothetical protein
MKPLRGSFNYLKQGEYLQVGDAIDFETLYYKEEAQRIVRQKLEK